VAYIFDPFRIARKRILERLDHLFVPLPGYVELFRSLSIPVSTVPMAADVTRFGSGGTVRPIDVTGYGRQPKDLVNDLSCRYNDPASPRVFNHTTFQKPQVRAHRPQRRLFWKYLTRSRISLCFDVLEVNPNQRFGQSFVAQRWFESLAAGCAVVGRRPACPEAAELLHWEDATIELPDAVPEAIEFLDALLEDRARLDRIHRRNYAHMLAEHDWRHRLVSMLDDMGHEPPVELAAFAASPATPSKAPASRDAKAEFDNR